jgi:hypothetical protein
MQLSNPRYLDEREKNKELGKFMATQNSDLKQLFSKIMKVGTKTLEEADENGPYLSGIFDHLYSLQHRQRLNSKSIKFVLESYLFIVNRKSMWKIIYQFSTGKFSQINRDVSILMQKKTTLSLNYPELSQQWLDMMTSPELPIIPDGFFLSRCNLSGSEFSIIDKDFFDSYQTTSTTFLATDTSTLPTGHCIGHVPGKFLGIVYMYLTFSNIPGLLISFPKIVGKNEEEVVLPPGMRYTWNKTKLDELRERVPKEKQLNFIDGEFKIPIPFDEFFEHHRIYDVTFIPNPQETKFQNPEIAQRVANLRFAIEKMNKIFAKHKAQKTHEKIQDYLLKSRQRARERIKAKALANLANQIEMEDRKIGLKTADVATQQLPKLMQKALDAENDMQKTKTKKSFVIAQFVNVEKVFQQSHQHKLKPSKILNKFILSKYAQKYATDLTKRGVNIKQ